MQRLLTHQANKAGPSQLCRALGVSRSGLHAALKRRQQRPVITEQAVQVRAAFAASGGTYGTRRISAALRQQGIHAGRHRVRSIMRGQGLRACWRRKFVHTTDSRHALPVADNLLDRQFQPEQPNTAWAGDITYVRTDSGWLYLAVVIELYSRKVIGWACAPHMQSWLVCQALNMAITTRQPAPGLLMHTDRGSQYASQAHTALLAAHQLCPSMSRKGNCWDNAVTERFFLNLKMERIWRRQYANHAEAQRDIADYIVNFYNPHRLHSSLGYLSPSQFEQLQPSPHHH